MIPCNGKCDPPLCPQGHGPMTLRTNPSEDAAWCGTWHDCHDCHSAHLDPSAELTEFLSQFRAYEEVAP